MPVHDYRHDSCFGRDPIADMVIETAFAGRSSHRGLVLEGPANRGKSWVVCRIRDKLSDAAALAALVPGAPPVAVCLFTHSSGHVNGAFDPLWAMAEVWYALRRFRPALLWPQALPAEADPAQALPAIHALFVQEGLDGAAVAERVAKELSRDEAALTLVLLVDGLDEFENLRSFERELLEPLVGSDAVLVIASRRSQVMARWNTFSMRAITRQEPIDVTTLDLPSASRQIDTYFSHAQPLLRFGTLAPAFVYYVWQNPGANRQFADDAIQNYALYGGSPPRLITQTNIRDCVLELSTSARHRHPISAADLDWLVEVVRTFPKISHVEVPIFQISPVLSVAAGRRVGDKECNEWLNRLHERGIVALRRGPSCLVYEEFAALCRE